MKKPLVTTTILQPGQICAFFDHEHFYHGMIVTVLDKAVQVCSENGDLLSFSPARLVILSKAVYSTADSRTTLMQFSEEVNHSLLSLSAEALWQRLQGSPQALSLQDIVNLCGLQDTDTCRFALFTVLKEHPCLFRHKGDVYFVLSEEETIAAQSKEKERQQDFEYKQAVEQWVGQIVAKTSPLSEFEQVLQSRLERELSLQPHSKPLHWLNQIFHHIAPDQSYRDLLLSVRMALGQIDKQTDRFLAFSGLPVLFPASVLDAACKAKPFTVDSARRDLTELECWTIDAAETEDIDDAISLQQTESGWELGIHISDVAYFVTPGSLIDLEAAKRTSSIYLPTANIHMLPEQLSCHLASLKAGEARPALSIIFQIDAAYKITSHEINLSAIMVNKRFSYEEIGLSLDSASPYSALNNLSLTLQKIANKHLQQRTERGARIVEDSTQSPARRLIAELMVIYNSRMAGFAKLHKLPFYYRYLEELIPEQNDSGFADGLIFPPSVLGTKPIAHQAMGLDVYAQMTSPLRRYADLVNQRQVISCLNHCKPIYNIMDLEKLIPHLLQTRQAIRRVTYQSEQEAEQNSISEY